jgi:hypothetical protein
MEYKTGKRLLYHSAYRNTWRKGVAGTFGDEVRIISF